MVDCKKYLGNFLKAEDLKGKPPTRLTISAVVEEKVGREGEEQDKLIMQFTEIEQSLPMNKTNIMVCVKMFKTHDTNQWIGQPVVLEFDPTVMFKGNIKGGIRIRPATQEQVARMSS